ncbi:MAG: hypothetical protein PHO40_03065 [Candidatus Omnitrophica bacterium]|jgi:hypothetical protein|nr:hypothetical protein [Candidatus Omnitrophota bacterium]
MLRLKDTMGMDKKINEIEDLLHNLLKEWTLDLNPQEKEIWLWNAMVGMAKIKQRRSIDEKASIDYKPIIYYSKSKLTS